MEKTTTPRCKNEHQGPASALVQRCLVRPLTSRWESRPTASPLQQPPSSTSSYCQPLRSQRELSFAPTPLRDVSPLAANFQHRAALQVDGLSAGRARCRRRGANGEKFHVSVGRDKHFSLIRREDLTEFPVF